MELTNIKKLIENYFDGNTSIEEEKALQKYFAQDKIAPELQLYKSMFQYFKEDTKATFDLDSLALPANHKKSKLVVMKWFAAAASIVLFAGIYIKQSQPKYSKAEKIAAYNEYKKAMYMLGGNINKGVAQVEVIETFEQTKNKVLK
jgi:hypothetical protein